jgi:hypothetical protein
MFVITKHVSLYLETYFKGEIVMGLIATNVAAEDLSCLKEISFLAL